MGRFGSRYALGAVVTVIAGALSGCAGEAPPPLAVEVQQPSSAPSSAPPSSAPSPSAPSPSVPVPSTLGAGTPVPVIRILPDSAAGLPRGYDLVPVPGAPDLTSALKRPSPRAGLVIEGGLNRLFTRGGRPLGGVQMFRVRNAFADRKQMGEIFDQMVQEYTADPAPARRVLAGRDVVWVDKARKSKHTVIAWVRGRDVLMLWGPDQTALRKLAVAMLTPDGA